ncbi:MAG: hypothetical protein J4G14_15100 [Dehalococcoidia bacterium]|nr:hypothetical protein [Dehalococcoidia bacterium]
MAYEFDLGSYSRPITTSSPEAQLWFDRGLLWTYGFNHEEAVFCFKQAAEADPKCAMAYWGIAYAMGPNYNKPWEAFDEAETAKTLSEAYDATMSAAALAGRGTQSERDLIEALHQRYQSAQLSHDLPAWIDDFAAAMRAVYLKHREDADISALFAEALMNRTPWALWDLASGEAAAGADTEEVRQALERGMERRANMGAPPHPGMLHMYIHLMEMSPFPEQALLTCEQLRGLVPDAGHLQHMATHIDVLCGDYLSVVNWNQAAIRADLRYLDARGPFNFYTLYRCHDYHFKAYGAMFLGQYQSAIEAAEELIGALPENLLSVQSPPMADWLEGLVPVKQHVLVRFGKWQEILAQELPANPDLYCVTSATMRYARAIAFATLGDAKSAEAEAEGFERDFDRVPESRYLFNNSCRDILAVAREMLLGELDYRRGDIESGFVHLRQAVALDDNLPYDEPWGWMQPARHALGALLLEQGRVAEALAEYRADLGFDPVLKRSSQHPDNVWSLSGYHECLERTGQHELAAVAKQRLDLARARADVPVQASCFCRLESAG